MAGGGWEIWCGFDPNSCQRALLTLDMLPVGEMVSRISIHREVSGPCEGSSNRANNP